MLNFLVRRVAQIVPTLVFVSMLIFGLQQLLPGDPALVLAGEDRDPNVVAYLHEKLHLDEPLPVRYAYWIGGVLRGDLGESMRLGKPVLELILQKLPVTLELALLAIVIALAIGIPAGIISAVKRNTGWDYAANVIALWGLSTPNFWLGIMLILLFSVTLGWLPASGFVSPFEDLARQPRVADHARVRARQRDRRRADAPHAQRDAAGALVRLRAHRARQGPAGTARRAAACAAQRADPRDHAGRAGIRHAAVRRSAHRAGVHDPRLRQADRRCGLQPRLRRRAGRRAVHGDRLHRAQPARRHRCTWSSIRGCGSTDGDAGDSAARARRARLEPLPRAHPVRRLLRRRARRARDWW